MTVGYNSNPNRLEASASKKRVLSSRETLPLAVIDLKRNDFCIWGFINILLCVLGSLALHLPIGLEPGISFHQMLRQNLWMVNLTTQLYQQDSYIFFSIVFHCFGFLWGFTLYGYWCSICCFFLNPFQVSWFKTFSTFPSCYGSTVFIHLSSF